MSKDSVSFGFTIFHQRTFLHRILKDEKYAVQAINLLKVDAFDSDSLKWIVRNILGGFDTVRILISELKKDKKIDEDLKSAIASDLRTFVKKFNEKESDYSFEILREGIETQDLSDVVLSVAEKIDDGGHKAKDLRSELLLAAFGGRTTENQTVDILSDFESRLRKRKEIAESGKIVFLKTGFKNIDTDINGPRRGQFWVFFGDTNIGKSQAAISVGRANVLQGFKVLHFGLEDLLEMTQQRYDASFTKVTYDKLTWANYSKEEEQKMLNVFKVLRKQRSNHLYLSKLSQGASVQDMYTEYKRLQSTCNFKPDLFVLDSPHNMGPIRKQENYRLDQKQIYLEVIDLAQRENIAIIAFDQSKQETKGKLAGTEAASESYDKARIADGFLTMNQSKMQRKDGIIEIFTAKMRDRDKHRSYLQRPNFKISRYSSIEER